MVTKAVSREREKKITNSSQRRPKLIATDTVEERKKKKTQRARRKKKRKRNFSNSIIFADTIISRFQLLYIRNSETHDFIWFHLAANHHTIPFALFCALFLLLYFFFFFFYSYCSQFLQVNVNYRNL